MPEFTPDYRVASSPRCTFSAEAEGIGDGRWCRCENILPIILLSFICRVIYIECPFKCTHEQICMT